MADKYPEQGVKAYAVVSGSYSDYTVHAIFTNRLAALEAAVQHGQDDTYSAADVEDIVLYEDVPEKETIYRMIQTIWDDGRVQDDLRQDSDTRLPWNTWYDAPRDGRPKVRYVRAPMHKDKGGRLEVFGRDEQAVKQAFSDRKAQILAGPQGLL